MNRITSRHREIGCFKRVNGNVVEYKTIPLTEPKNITENNFARYDYFVQTLLKQRKRELSEPGFYCVTWYNVRTWSNGQKDYCACDTRFA